MTRRHRLAALAGLSALLTGLLTGLAVPGAPADDLPPVVVVAGPQADTTGYATPVVAVPEGGSLWLASIEHILTDHDVVHDWRADTRYGSGSAAWCGNFPAGRCPLFWSKRVNAVPRPLSSGDPLRDGPVTPVLGIEDLPAGQYPFYCSIHGDSMRGTLVVVGGI